MLRNATAFLAAPISRFTDRSGLPGNDIWRRLARNSLGSIALRVPSFPLGFEPSYDRLSSEGIFRRRAFALIYGHGQRSDVKVQVLCHFMSTFERRSFQVKTKWALDACQLSTWGLKRNPRLPVVTFFDRKSHSAAGPRREDYRFLPALRPSIDRYPRFLSAISMPCMMMS
jgi:hypothetical protein